MADRVKAIGAILVTFFTGLLIVWWLALLAQRLGVKPVVENGAVVLDEFQRAKDILTVLLPLFTAAIAFFVGNQGAEKAKAEAKDAKTEAADARSEADQQRKKSEALLEAAPEEVIAKARQLRPAAF